jgi:ADP-ribosyl-[dinitrogen reductase] hydrolase
LASAKVDAFLPPSSASADDRNQKGFLMPHSFSSFRRAVRGGFIGLAVGDALGVPAEGHSYDWIMRKTGYQGIVGYLDPKLSCVKDTQGLPVGSTSDDTQLARVTARSLIRSRGFDIEDQGRGLIEEFERTKFGWGGTTTAAAVAIKEWRDSHGEKGRHPAAPAPVPTTEHPSAGSGPAIKVFPLAAYYLIGRNPDRAAMPFLDHAMSLALMTHGDVRACVASVALGHAIAAFARLPSFATDARDKRFIATEVMRATKRAESIHRNFRPQAPPFSAYLERAFSLLDDPLMLRTEVNTGFLAVESVPFAIATALRHPDDFHAAVCEGVSAGHDTDTVGAMIGAMIGSRVGLEGIPAEWRESLLDRDAILDEADQLCKVAFDIDPDDDKRVIPEWLKGERN